MNDPFMESDPEYFNDLFPDDEAPQDRFNVDDLDDDEWYAEWDGPDA